MASVGRKLGVNIRTCMLEANISLDSFAKHLEYSIKDVWNVIEGKVIIPPGELDNIAKFLKTTKSELLNRESDSLVPDLQYMKDNSVELWIEKQVQEHSCTTCGNLIVWFEQSCKKCNSK